MQAERWKKIDKLFEATTIADIFVYAKKKAMCNDLDQTPLG